MSEVEPAMANETDSLERGDLLWLEECLERYRDLLTYLHDH